MAERKRDRERPGGIQVDNIRTLVLGMDIPRKIWVEECAQGKADATNSCTNGSSERVRDATVTQIYNQCST